MANSVRREQARNRQKEQVRKSRAPYAVAVVLVFVIGGAIAFLFYVNNYEHASGEAQAAMQSTSTVEVREIDGGWAFVPTPAVEPSTGIVFYPGGKVEAAAYAPLMQRLADAGFTCALMEMPFNLAVLDPAAADKAFEQLPEVGTWYLAGHSMGGAFGAMYADEHADQLEGLILLAAYSTADLTDSDLKVLSIYGSEDGVLKMDEYEKDKVNLPMLTECVIKGGNHSNFGDYGLQATDNEPAISREEQQELTVEEIVEFAGLAA